MFEGQQSQLEDVMQSNPEFRRLYYQHKELDKKVMDAELGVLPMDDTTLSQMKREKLAAKDRLTRMYATLEH
ncbi:YdcH family protein [Luteimonas dalianensis]|uniref:YdcH family protein n=1 Tax=Luteimonas dalianensis TaxID=1148196 RepID=UPI003BF05169